jgi:hypothetical protein
MPSLRVSVEDQGPRGNHNCIGADVASRRFDDIATIRVPKVYSRRIGNDASTCTRSRGSQRHTSLQRVRIRVFSAQGRCLDALSEPWSSRAQRFALEPLHFEMSLVPALFARPSQRFDLRIRGCDPQPANR